MKAVHTEQTLLHAYTVQYIHIHNDCVHNAVSITGYTSAHIQPDIPCH